MKSQKIVLMIYLLKKRTKTLYGNRKNHKMIKIEYILEPIASWGLILMAFLCLKEYASDFVYGMLVVAFLVFEGIGL